MTNAIEATGLTRRFGQTLALDDVSFGIEEHVICGLLGRNGAGKTTIMSLLTGQDRATSGEIRAFGAEPFENQRVQSQLCFIRDNQRYPDDYKLKHVLRIAPEFYPNWDADLAARLVEEFRIPTKPVIKKFSRGQTSAVAIVIGLAARAPITFFDEPYLGLDATARQIFYDRLLADYAEHPRTIVLSTHLIDEMEQLLEQIIIVDQGRILRDTTVDEARGLAYTVTGAATAVDAYGSGRRILREHAIGGLKSLTIEGAPEEAAGLEFGLVGLQDLVAAYGADATREGVLA